MKLQNNEPTQPTLAQLHLIARHWKRWKPFSSLAVSSTDITLEQNQGGRSIVRVTTEQLELQGTVSQHQGQILEHQSQGPSIRIRDTMENCTSKKVFIHSCLCKIPCIRWMDGISRSAAAEEEIKETNNGAGERTHPEKACT